MKKFFLKMTTTVCVFVEDSDAFFLAFPQQFSIATTSSGYLYHKSIVGFNVEMCVFGALRMTKQSLALLCLTISNDLQPKIFVLCKDLMQQVAGDILLVDRFDNENLFRDSTKALFASVANIFPALCASIPKPISANEQLSIMHRAVQRSPNGLTGMQLRQIARECGVSIDSDYKKLLDDLRLREMIILNDTSRRFEECLNVQKSAEIVPPSDVLPAARVSFCTLVTQEDMIIDRKDVFDECGSAFIEVCSKQNSLAI